MAETPEKDAQANKQPVAVQQEGDKQPAAVQQGASSRLTVTVVSLAALAIIGAATANSFPKLDRLALPNFDHFSLPKFDHLASNFSWPNLSWPNFNRTASPNSSRVAAQPPQKTAPPAIPDPIIVAALTDIQVSQRQTAAVLASLTESSAAQQADMKRISRQVTLLTVQVDSLRGAVTPLTTSSIPTANPRARIIRTSRRTTPPLPPPLPKPVGPVSVGGAPLNPAPASGSGA